LTVSTGKLRGFRRFHIQPINLVVYQGSLTGYPARKPDLEGGFTLICLQRFAFPNLATQRCPWRDNWYTIGSFLKILSY